MSMSSVPSRAPAPACPIPLRIPPLSLPECGWKGEVREATFFFPKNLLFRLLYQSLPLWVLHRQGLTEAWKHFRRFSFNSGSAPAAIAEVTPA